MGAPALRFHWWGLHNDRAFLASNVLNSYCLIHTEFQSPYKLATNDNYIQDDSLMDLSPNVFQGSKLQRARSSVRGWCFDECSCVQRRETLTCWCGWAPEICQRFWIRLWFNSFEELQPMFSATLLIIVRCVWKFETINLTVQVQLKFS